MFTFPVGFFSGSTGDPHWSNVVLYLPLTGVNNGTIFTDLSQYNHLVTANGGIVTSTNQAPSLSGVSSSAFFDGVNDWLSLADHPGWQFGTGDWTVEFFWYGLSFGTYTMIVGTQDGDFDSGQWRIGNRFNSLNRCYFARATGSGMEEPVYNTNINDSAWKYVAVTRASGVMSHYVNAVKLTPISGSENIPSTMTTSNALRIGYNQINAAYISGYLSHLRITKGIARTIVSVPTAPFPIG